jgi:hypothetical protein
MQLCLAEVTIVSLTEDQKELSRFNEKYTKSALIQFSHERRTLET